MRVTCPNCAAGYEVPDHLLAAGTRTLRCARCGTTFQAGPVIVEPATPVEPPVIDPPPDPPPTLSFPRAPPAPLESRVVFHPPMIGPARLPPRSRSGAAIGAAGWLLTVLLLAGAAVGAIQSRDRIIAAWPASARAYGAIGLNPAAAAVAPAPVARPPAARTSSAGP